MDWKYEYPWTTRLADWVARWLLPEAVRASVEVDLMWDLMGEEATDVEILNEDGSRTICFVVTQNHLETLRRRRMAGPLRGRKVPA
jgi:hypothetical protein